MFERFHLIIVFESTFECGSRRTSLNNISVYSYSLATSSLASRVHSYGANAWVSLISIFMAWTTFPYHISCAIGGGNSVA